MYKALLAGACIALGSYCYLCVGGIPGAVLFSLGLLTVINLKLPLYTGLVSNKKAYERPLTLLQYLLYNVIGSVLMTAPTITNRQVMLKAKEIVESKLESSWFIVIANAVICGMCVSIAVKIRKDLVTVLAVAAFVLCKGEHCIADAYYLMMSASFSLKSLLFLILVIIGNTVGGLIFLKISPFVERGVESV